MKKFFLFASIVAVLLAYTTQILACLDETRAQCDARYGNPVSEKKVSSAIDTVVYEKNGLQIIVHFLRGRAGGIGYIKEKGNLSDTEKRTLFEANKGTAANALDSNWRRLGSTNFWTGYRGREAHLTTTKDLEGEGIIFKSGSFREYETGEKPLFGP